MRLLKKHFARKAGVQVLPQITRRDLSHRFLLHLGSSEHIPAKNTKAEND